MASKLECILCGGVEFYKEAGFYYCNECQTQTQELREHVFDEDVHLLGTTKKISKPPKSKSTPDESLTSWECYNFILLGLVNELIELGANKTLKKTVKILWIKYLTKLGVVNEDSSHIPKLQAVNSSRDAQIVYGVQKPKKRRRRKSHSGNSSSSMSSVELQREIGKRKRNSINVEQDDLIKSETVTQSLHNQSLSSFKTNINNASGSCSIPIQYNKPAAKELKKIMSSNHLSKHKKDKLNMFTCHKISYKNISNNYIYSAAIITRKRIFSILYVGLLIIKDKIQLGDMLRYIKEGHLSYTEYLHFFPESLGKVKLNISSYTNAAEILTHAGVRETAWKIIKFLEIETYVPTQNIIELTERYCLELNLPDEIYQSAVSIISETLPYKRKCTLIRNYEGRAICYIIFILKLLFGLDGVTEYHFSKFAKIINEHNKNEKKMFHFAEWLQFIEYRKLILCENNFPTFSKENNATFSNPNLFINFMKEYNSKYDITCSTKFDYNVLQNLLLKLSVMQENLDSFISFEQTLTPFHTYLKKLLSTELLKRKKYQINILEQNFTSTSLTFLLHAEQYLTNPNLEIRHGGANNLFEFVNISLPKLHTDLNQKVAVFINDEVTPQPSTAVTQKSINVAEHTKNRMTNYYKEHERCLNRNKRKYEKSCEKKNYDAFYKIHYHPDESFWLRSEDISSMSIEQFKDILAKLPFSFQLILKECARITEQTCQNLYEEYCIVEQHLCYNLFKTKQILNKDLKNLVDKNEIFY